MKVTPKISMEGWVGVVDVCMGETNTPLFGERSNWFYSGSTKIKEVLLVVPYSEAFYKKGASQQMI
jgi:hypothetical protein